MSTTVYLASDHAGFALKGVLAERLRADGYEVDDLGAHTFDEQDDYPDFILPCAGRVAEENPRGKAARVFGIVIGASGQGEAMCANRVHGARAVVFYGEPPRPQTDAAGHELSLIASARTHNDANILSIGARFVSEEEAVAAARAFLTTSFSNDERHVRRLAKFSA